jgi:hypothetical protein
MEGVIFSNGSKDRTIDAIELLLELDCRNIWLWMSSETLYNEIITEHWEKSLSIQPWNSEIATTGDCLRELYLRNESRDNISLVILCVVQRSFPCIKTILKRRRQIFYLQMAI